MQGCGKRTEFEKERVCAKMTIGNGPQFLRHECSFSFVWSTQATFLSTDIFSLCFLFLPALPLLRFLHRPFSFFFVPEEGTLKAPYLKGPRPYTLASVFSIGML